MRVGRLGQVAPVLHPQSAGASVTGATCHHTGMTATSLSTIVFVGLSLLLVVGQARPHPQPVSNRTGADPHGYFTRLTTRGDVLASYSLRDPAQLTSRANGGFTQSDSREIGVTYSPATDRYARKQDAAKVVIPADGNNLRNQVRLPLAHKGAGFLVTWDAWWGEEFAFDRAGIEDYKAFQLESGGRIWTEIRTRFRRARRFPGSIALIDVRPYKGSSEKRGSVVRGTKYGNGSLAGLQGNFPIAPDTWTRFWVQLAPRGGDGWWNFSLWVADEKRDAVQLYADQAVKPNGTGWDRLWLEYNTSTRAVKPNRGELVSYVRNVVVLKSQSDLKPLLERPLGMSTARTPSDVPTGGKRDASSSKPSKTKP